MGFRCINFYKDDWESAHLNILFNFYFYNSQILSSTSSVHYYFLAQLVIGVQMLLGGKCTSGNTGQ